ncbi:ABC transporter permease [Marinicella gelatinilytica]|uniref:ABC transporter permease n=1 Tax=Marinicella gelatinilytica TaxID=2996017 RepID=UPI002260C95F|nr:ABC transporter permease [Marinicella gelatinilytica]MCX7545929.1 ABC transporter permease [Marinicella gelatinilytica]
MNFRAFKTVFFKEVLENARDKRTVMSSIVMGALFGPILLVIIINTTINMQQDKAEQALEVPVINQTGANHLMQFLTAQDVDIVDFEGSPEEAIKNKEHDVVLAISDNFSQRFNQGQPAKVKLYHDASAKGTAKVSVNRLRSLLNAYERSIGTQRLQLRGISPNLINVIMIEEHDQATKESRGSMLLAALPYFLIMGLFMGSMYLAIDTTAGEKERKSLEPLFLNPVKRDTILAGKLAATVAFGLLTLVLTIVAFKLTLPWYPFEKLGMRFNMDLQVILIMFLVLAPLALLAGAIQTIIAAFAQSYREAQTYVGFVLIVPMIPSMLLMFMPIKESLWMMAVPVLGQNLVVNELMRGEMVAWDAIAMAVGGTLIVGLALAWIAVKLYNREKMLFAD